MLGRIIDLNSTDAFVTFEDGTTLDISLSRLPQKVKIGETINIAPSSSNLQNDKVNNLFF